MSGSGVEAASVHRRAKPIESHNISRASKQHSKHSKQIHTTKKSVEQLMTETEVQHHVVEEVLSDTEEEVRQKYFSYDYNYSHSMLKHSASSGGGEGEADIKSTRSQYSNANSRLPGSTDRRKSPGRGSQHHHLSDGISALSVRSMNSSSETGLSYSSRLLGSTRSVLIYQGREGEEEEPTVPKEITMKEIIEKVAKNIKSGKKKQAYISDMNELSNENLYWNKKYPLLKKYKQKEMRNSASDVDIKDDISELSGFGANSSRNSCSFSSLPSLGNKNIIGNKIAYRRIVDIQGCMQPVELILAKAHERITKESKAQSKWEDMKEVRRVKVLESIENREKRAERYVAKLKESYLVKAWLAITWTAIYLKQLLPKYENKTAEIVKTIKFGSASQVLVRAILRWYKNLIYVKYKRKLLAKMSKDTLWYLKFKLKILKKRRAIKKVLYFLKSIKDAKKISFVVHRFVTSVKRIQKICHSFLACKRARVAIITKMWDKLEPKFVAAVLNARKNGVKKKGQDGKFLKISGFTVKDLIELEKQNQRWNEIEQKISDSILKQTLLGNLNTNSADLVSKHLLTPEVKAARIIDILINRRRAHLLHLNNLYDAKVSKLSNFSEEDAYDLLQGRTAEIDRIVQEKFELTSNRVNAKSTSRDESGNPVRLSLPFIIYAKLTRKIMYAEIKKAHIEAKSFDIENPRSTKQIKKGDPFSKRTHENDDEQFLKE